MISAFDKARLDASSAWEVYEITPIYRRSRLEMEPGKFIIKTEHFADDEIVEDNKRLFDESITQRFGDGKVIARIPLNKFYADLSKGIGEGDKDHLKWWLNNEKNKQYRTFRGRV